MPKRNTKYTNDIQVKVHLPEDQLLDLRHYQMDSGKNLSQIVEDSLDLWMGTYDDKNGNIFEDDDNG